MNLDPGNASVFVEGRDGAAFVLWLCLGIGAPRAAGLLLPWPPGPADSVMAVLVFLVCGAVVWHVGGRREVAFERAARTVVERVTLAGVPRERRVVLAGDARVEVTQTSVKVARPGTDSRQRTSSDYDTHHRFRLALRSGSATVRLDIVTDVLEAERRAGEVAALLGVPAVRDGYSIDVEAPAGGAAASADTRRVVTVRSHAGRAERDRRGALSGAGRRPQRLRRRPAGCLHQQVLARVVAAEDDVVHLADVGELRAAGVRDRALHVFLHLAQRVGELALDRLEDALALDVLVLALVEVRRRAVVLLEQLAVDLDRLARRLVVAGEQRPDHHHARAEADALGDVAVVADAAVGDDRLGRHARAPLQRRELPAAGAEARLQLGDADLAGTDADLGRVGAPVLEDRSPPPAWRRCRR
jgi:hypothetical protein